MATEVKWVAYGDEISSIVGKTPVEITCTEDEITFIFNDGTACMFYHEQSCCEHVTVDDVNGDWGDLIGVPLLVADERVSDREEIDYSVSTWTFYTFRSIKGSVDVKWYGESNGYYSERVDFKSGVVKK